MVKPKILIVDDNRYIGYVYKKLLRDKFELIYANNGMEAVRAFKMSNPDLTLMDINMPFMMGDEAIKRIRDHDSNAIIIAVTAYDYDEYALGVPVLRKPFVIPDFMRIILSGLGGGGNPVIHQHN
jgi:CheY-like chemotaxis protein